MDRATNVERVPLSSTEIHPTAHVDGRAELGSGVRVGPFCIIGPHVRLGDDVDVLSHVSLSGHTTVGARTRISSFAAIGHDPQDAGHRGEPTTISIGQDCVIREGVTAHVGTLHGRGQTTIGDGCIFLPKSHVAHDCQVGSNVVMTDNAMMAGHCQVGDYAVVGSGAGLHQFVRVGTHAFIGKCSAVLNDVIPYGVVQGNRANLQGLNIIGLRRRGFSRGRIHELRRAYRLLFADEGTFAERIEDVAEDFGGHPMVQEVLDFLRSGGDRAFCLPAKSLPRT